MTFADAIEKYGKRLNEDSLAMAYNRTGMAFKEQLQMNFVVLKDLPRPTSLVLHGERKDPLKASLSFLPGVEVPKRSKGVVWVEGGCGGSGFGPRGRGNTGGGGRGGKGTSFWQGK